MVMTIIKIRTSVNEGISERLMLLLTLHALMKQGQLIHLLFALQHTYNKICIYSIITSSC